MSDLDIARELLDEIEDEYARLVRERLALGALPDIIGEDRAHSLDALIGEVDDFVSGTFRRVEARAERGDLDAARRLRESSARILSTLRVTRPVVELTDDATEVVRDTVADLGDVAASSGSIATWAALGAVAGAVAGSAVGAQATGPGAIVGALVGAAIRFGLR